ncbi:MAG: signal peptidase I [Propionibacteriaceae bacterium]|nr:signal peptidase I [Propionibacteriaceae bacterium]
MSQDQFGHLFLPGKPEGSQPVVSEIDSLPNDIWSVPENKPALNEDYFMVPAQQPGRNEPLVALDPAFTAGVQPNDTAQTETKPTDAAVETKKAKKEKSSTKEPKPPRTTAQVIGSWVREILIVIVGALIASTLLRMFVIQLYQIPSGSMEDLVTVGDRVAIQKVLGFSRGDVVVFQDTQNWLFEEPKEYDWWHQALIFVGLAPDESVGFLIKRVLGMPGDHVVCCNERGKITINGAELEEDYLFQDPVTGELAAPSLSTFDVVVPAGHVYVLGDHRNSSYDSRCHLLDPTNGGPSGMNGFVPTENIVGTAIARVYPFSRFMGISTPAVYETIPDATGDPPAAPVINGAIQPCVNR